MYEKVLVPLDGSEMAEGALLYAEQLAGRLGSEITLVYVNELSSYLKENLIQSYLQKMVEVTKEGVSRYRSAPGISPSIEVKSVIVPGSPAETIIEYADSNNMGSIIMSTHGQSGIKQWALGSVAERVVRATTKPVLLVRANILGLNMREKGLFNKVLVPLDGSIESEAIIPYVEEFAPRLNVNVILLRVLARGYRMPDNYAPLSYEQLEADKVSANAYLDRVGAHLKEKGVSVMTELRSGIEIRSDNAAEQIIQLANEAQADLVAMTTHGRSGVEQKVFGSVAERVLYEGNTPLMLVRPPGTIRQ